ncbi:MAG: 2-amino-4-hydroxy-6-hydroxymethyldihydropteridine diphosphokinase [Actinobacteria bacterium]|nr:2-amino-4-hydroxy-6-hydroxymethyldihydropteridine diphosphokinase [Actinomycetota bacterium]
MVKAAISLGSNLGDRLGQLRGAIRRLEEAYPILAVSSLFLTEPIGGPVQDEFLNAVVLLELDESPEQLLAKLQQIEDQAGRVRDEHWGPRTLDLDLITVRGATANSEELILPHPRAHLRRFVVAPLTEVWRDAQLQGGTASDHLDNLIDQKALRVAKEWKDDRIQFLDRGSAWVWTQAAGFVIFGVVVFADGRWPEGWQWLGLPPIALSAYLMLQAAAALGEAFTPFPTPREAQLAARGVYRFVRHPMYAGIVLLFAGTALLVGSVWAGVVAVVTAIFFWFKGGFEEKRLRIVYAAYDEYRKQVRGRLIPGIW